MRSLADAKLTTVVLVSRPDSAALQEAARTSTELRALGVVNQRLIVNAVFHARDRNDLVALAFERRDSTLVRGSRKP